MVDDGIGLTIDAAVSGGPAATITDTGLLIVTGAGSVTANAVGLTGTSVTIAGLVSDGGMGTTSLIAAAGTIDETGTFLGPFSAIGLTVNDGIGLTVGAAVTGGPSATLTDAGPITVTGAGSVVAQAVSLTATGIGIAGLVSDGGTGTTRLLATDGGITATGTLLSGALSGSATGTATLLGVTPTTNRIADIGPFTATGFVLNDGIGLVVSGPVAGGPTAVITDSALLTVASSLTANAVNLTARTLDIPGLVSAGGAGTTQLIATTGGITETGALVSGTLNGAAAGAADLIGGNTIASLGGFSAGAGLALDDAVNLTVNGPVSAGPSATITDAGALTIAGSLGGSAVQLTAGAIALPGAINAAGSLTLTSASTIGETGRLFTPQLSGSAPSAVSLTGTNQIGGINWFSANGLTVNDAANLLLSGTLTSPSIIINDTGFLITLGNNAGIVTGGTARPPGPITAPPPTSSGGAFLTNFQQVGNSFVTGLGGSPSILVITAGPGQNIGFDLGGGLHGPNTWLVLDLTVGDQAFGNIFVNALDVLHGGTGGRSSLFGTISGISGPLAAGVGHVAPTVSSNFRFNSCPIASVNCLLLPVEGIPVGNPLNDFSLDTAGNPNDEDDLLLPVVSDQDY